MQAIGRKVRSDTDRIPIQLLKTCGEKQAIRRRNGAGREPQRHRILEGARVPDLRASHVPDFRDTTVVLMRQEFPRGKPGPPGIGAQASAMVSSSRNWKPPLFGGAPADRNFLVYEHEVDVRRKGIDASPAIFAQ